MKEVTATGKTVEAAVESALAQLKTTRDQTEITIINEAKQGIFGIFGSKQATVKVEIVFDAVEEARSFLKKVITNMGVSVTIDTEVIGKTIEYKLSGDKLGILIGKRGNTLNSLQYLTQIVANKNSKLPLQVIIDAENYRKRREQTLIELAERLSNKVLSSKKEVKLEPMPAFERKVIHTALAKNDFVQTFSDGDGSKRSVVIAPIKK